MFSNLFKMGGEVDKKTATILQFSGWIFMFLLWYFIAEFKIISTTILPHPIKDEFGRGVYTAFVELFSQKRLLFHAGYSIFINLAGYIEAILASLILGFLIGLYPGPRAFFSKQIDALRFLPLPSTTGIFMALFGMSLLLKINFLAFGIFIYLLPVVVQRILETDKVHLQTINTLTNSKIQKLTKVYIPSVFSRVFMDIIVLVAISYTYIVIIEAINNEGGLGGLASSSQRGRTDIVYAILISIIIIGFIQDKLLRKIDKSIHKFKYA